MNDLPERIWVYKTDDGNLGATGWEVTGDVEYLRKDLAPPVGPLIEALERLSVLGNAPYPGTSEGNMIAREALAAWKGGRDE